MAAVSLAPTRWRSCARFLSSGGSSAGRKARNFVPARDEVKSVLKPCDRPTFSNNCPSFQNACMRTSLRTEQSDGDRADAS